jgi:enoyl-CoA hydratase/carnithine racemase
MPDTTTVSDILLRQDKGAVAILTLNRPAQRNPLSEAMLAALAETLDAIAADASIRAVMLQAEGKAFSAGHDLKEVQANRNRDYYDWLLRECAGVMKRIVRLPQPMIAAVEGIATAAGCQLVASADIAFASEDARFATPGVNIGLFCSTPMVALSRNVAPKHAMEMLLSGELMDAEHAMRIGLVNRVLPPGAVRGAALAFAESIASRSGYTVKVGKQAFYRQLELGLDEAYDYASDVMAENMMARDAEEGIGAFIEKREPKWEGQ